VIVTDSPVRAMSAKSVLNFAFGVAALDRILGELTAMAGVFPQALNQLSSGLRQALREYDVYDKNRDAAVSVEMAAAELAAAAEAFQRVSAHLSIAQEAINLQGVNTDNHDQMVRRPRLQAVESLEND
jgi:hypothetical protein